MRILFLGEPDNNINVSSQNAAALRRIGIDAAFDDNAFWSSKHWRETCRQTDLIHLITYVQHDPWFLRKIWMARLHGLPVVRLWVGSDALWARQYQPARKLAKALNTLGVVNLTVAHHLADEIRPLGIRAAIVPIIANFFAPAGDPPPLPDKPTALVYLVSDHKRDFYGGPIIDQLIRRRPDVTFLIVNDPNTDYSAFPNVESLGRITDMTPLYARTTVLIRPTAHDGMPRMMLEALSFGRHAICSYPYPHCRHAANLAEFLHALDTVTADPTLNDAGRQYVFEHFDYARATRITADTFEALLRTPRPLRRLIGTANAVTTLFKQWDLWRGSHYHPPTAQTSNLTLPVLPATA